MDNTELHEYTTTNTTTDNNKRNNNSCRFASRIYK